MADESPDAAPDPPKKPNPGIANLDTKGGPQDKKRRAAERRAKAQQKEAAKLRKARKPFPAGDRLAELRYVFYEEPHDFPGVMTMPEVALREWRAVAQSKFMEELTRLEEAAKAGAKPIPAPSNDGAEPKAAPAVRPDPDPGSAKLYDLIDQLLERAARESA